MGHTPRHYVKIWALLCVLLVISVVGPELEITLVTLFTAFGIAFYKAFLVCKHFMHLNMERPFIRYILITCLLFILMLFGGVAPDVLNQSGARWENYAAKEAVLRGMAAGEGEHHGAEAQGDSHGEPNSAAGSDEGHEGGGH